MKLINQKYLTKNHSVTDLMKMTDKEFKSIHASVKETICELDDILHGEIAYDRKLQKVRDIREIRKLEENK